MATGTTQQPPSILVLGDARRRALALRISKNVAGWLKTWSGSSGEQDIVVNLEKITDETNKAMSLDSTLSVSGSIGDVEHLVVTGFHGVLASVLNIPRRATTWPPIAESKIASAVCEEVLQALADSIASNLGLTAWHTSIEHRKPVRESSPGKYAHWWIADIGWASQQACVQLAFSPTLICQLAPFEPKFGVASLDKRRASIGDERLHLEAVLGEAIVSVGELASLAVNDVVVLRDELSHPSYLVTSAGRRVANVSLGRAGNKRAVMISK